jgi:hypothetical protein
VTIAVIDDLGQAVSGARVSGTWPAGTGTGGTTSCVTGSAGTCTVWRTVYERYASVQWTVTAVVHPTLAYDPAANGDPDGDSDGTSLTVRR